MIQNKILKKQSNVKYYQSLPKFLIVLYSWRLVYNTVFILSINAVNY